MREWAVTVATGSPCLCGSTPAAVAMAFTTTAEGGAASAKLTVTQKSVFCVCVCGGEILAAVAAMLLFTHVLCFLYKSGT